MKRFNTVIEFNDHHIKLFQACHHKGKWEVIFWAVSPVADCPDQESLEAFKGRISQLPAVPDNPTVLLPRRHAILRQMKFPSRDSGEIDDMIGLQLVNDIPFSADDVIYRHRVLNQDPDGYSLVLVVVICKEVVRKYEEILRQAGITDGTLILNSFGVLGWVVHIQGLRQMSGNQTVALLDLDAAHVQICFCHAGKLFFSRSVPHQGGYAIPAEREDLIREIRSSLDFYRSECLGPEVKSLWIPSIEIKADPFVQEIENQLGISATVLDPFGDISYTGRAFHDGGYSCSIAAGLGALLSDRNDWARLKLNTVSEKNSHSLQKPRIAVVVALLVIIVLVGVSGRLIGIDRSQEYLESLRRQAGRLRAESGKAKEKIKFVETLDGDFTRDIFLPDLFGEFSRLAPEGVSFKTFALDKDGHLAIEGYARTHAGVNEFQGRLAGSPRFQDIHLRFATGREVARMSVMDFKIDMRLRDDQGGWP